MAFSTEPWPGHGLPWGTAQGPFVRCRHVHIPTHDLPPAMETALDIVV